MDFVIKTLLFLVIVHWTNLIIGFLLAIVCTLWISHFKKSLEKLKSFINVYRSPVYSCINSSSSGLTTIRAY